MPLELKKQSSGSVTTPAANRIALFADSSSGTFRGKTESGSLINLGTALTVSASIATSTVTAAIGAIQRVSVSSNAVTVNLPAGHVAGDQIAVKLVSVATYNCTVDASGSETIDGSTTLVLSTSYEWVYLVSDGTNWMQLG